MTTTVPDVAASSAAVPVAVPAADDAPSPGADEPEHRRRRHDGHGRELGVVGGLAALALDALASVAYGPEAIVIVLAAAGAAGLGLTVWITVAIAVLLLVLVASYRQVIAAFPQGGGAYGVARAHLGPRSARLAAASLVIDYVLNVAVSVAAGVAALTSAVPSLRDETLPLALGVLALMTLVNLRGIAESARLFLMPAAVFVVSLAVVVVAGLLRSEPAASLAPPAQSGTLVTVGLLLVLRAFANGCSALTGVEAIANAVPSFRAPRVRRAQRAELVLGLVLAGLLIGIAVLIEKFDVRPGGDATVLARVTAAAIGDGAGFYVVQGATVLLLALAANTSFGGLPVLAGLLARDNQLPHVFGLRGDHEVYRYGVLGLSLAAAALLVVSGGEVNVLVPLFAIGVFVGFTLSQAGMVRHWLRERPERWRRNLALNGTGAALTGLAAIVLGVTKFTEGGWLVVVLLPLLALTFSRVEREYARIGARLGLGSCPAPPRPHARVVVVPVRGVDALARLAVETARSLGADVRAVHVPDADRPDETERLRLAWDAWDPGARLVVLPPDPRRSLARPVLDFLDRLPEGVESVLVIGEVEPRHRWARVLQNRRGAVLARAVRCRGDVLVCHARLPV